MDVRPVLIYEPFVGFMDQRRRVQRVVHALQAEPAMSSPAQIVVNNRHQPAERIPLARSDCR